MRKYYIDNIRILCILLLFPYHTAMIFNGFSEKWYVHGKPLFGATMFDVAVYPWWMSLLFALAGISTVYSLKSRTGKQYIKERIFKLFIPFISAFLLIVPVQPYLADKFFNKYTGSYIEHFSIFFSATDWSGYDGHLTPGHTWFILYLFLISMVTLPLIIWYKNRKKKIDYNNLNMIKIILMCIFILIGMPILNIGGKSIGEFTAYFLLGYFVLSIEEVQNKLEKYCVPLTFAWTILIIIRCTMYMTGMYHGFLWEVEHRVLGWIGILAVLGLGKKFLNFNSRFRKYFTAASFPLYIFHQSIIVIIGYFVVNHMNTAVLEYFIIMIMSFILSIFLYEVCRRIGITRFLFGIKKLQ